MRWHGVVGETVVWGCGGVAVGGLRRSGAMLWHFCVVAGPSVDCRESGGGGGESRASGLGRARRGIVNEWVYGSGA
jgi:hypothetical protein